MAGGGGETVCKPLKVGLVGTGSISNRHLAAYLEHPDRLELTAVCDVVEGAAREYAKRAGVDNVYVRFDDMLHNADIDAVDICTSHDQHAPQTIAAAGAGKHVLVEKSMANTLQSCRDMIEAADNARVTLMVGQQLRYSPEARVVKRFIDEGNLGHIQAVRTHVMTMATRKPWMNDAKYGGGILMLNSVHHIDLLRYYVGNVTRVMGMRRSLYPKMRNGAEDLVAATIEFENGAIGNIFGNWTTHLSPEPQSYIVFGSDGTLHSTIPETMERIERGAGSIMTSLKPTERNHQGSEIGTSIFRKTNNKTSRTPTFEPLLPIDIDLPTTNPIVNEILHFEECCRNGKEPLSSGRDNIETMKMIFGIFESSRTGRAISLQDI